MFIHNPDFDKNRDRRITRPREGLHPSPTLARSPTLTLTLTLSRSPRACGTVSRFLANGAGPPLLLHRVRSLRQDRTIPPRGVVAGCWPHVCCFARRGTMPQFPRLLASATERPREAPAPSYRKSNAQARRQRTLEVATPQYHHRFSSRKDYRIREAHLGIQRCRVVFWAQGQCVGGQYIYKKGNIPESLR